MMFLVIKMTYEGCAHVGQQLGTWKEKNSLMRFLVKGIVKFAGSGDVML